MFVGPEGKKWRRGMIMVYLQSLKYVVCQTDVKHRTHQVTLKPRLSAYIPRNLFRHHLAMP